VNGREWITKVRKVSEEELHTIPKEPNTQDFSRLISLLVRVSKGIEIELTETDLLTDSEEFVRGMERIRIRQQETQGSEIPYQFA